MTFLQHLIIKFNILFDINILLSLSLSLPKRKGRKSEALRSEISRIIEGPPRIGEQSSVRTGERFFSELFSIGEERSLDPPMDKYSNTARARVGELPRVAGSLTHLSVRIACFMRRRHRRPINFVRLVPDRKAENPWRSRETTVAIIGETYELSSHATFNKVDIDFYVPRGEFS